MAKIFIETERLVLREIIPEDAKAFFEMDSNPEVVKYVGIKPLTEIGQSVEMIKKHPKAVRRKRNRKMGGNSERYRKTGWMERTETHQRNQQSS
jgi:RimJ/RimL family protein N-acetyltransferase|nr:GNAT family N-acetyltransferase [Chryseobacterium sp. Hurlbut01]